MQKYVNTLSSYVTGEEIQTSEKPKPKQQPLKLSDLVDLKKNKAYLDELETLTNFKSFTLTLFERFVQKRNEELEEEHRKNIESGRTIIREHDRGDVVRKVVLSLNRMNKESSDFAYSQRKKKMEEAKKALEIESQFLIESLNNKKYERVFQT